ncbi:MAG: crotonase/enoyl-CoA hydratase family protein [Myxococcales bacterium]|nr:crotonase/enoyl-CoA hydratase family protein [Myxococcales bacterium]
MPVHSGESAVRVDARPPLAVVTIDRPAVRNAVDGPTARALYDAFVAFDDDDALAVAILRGEGAHFCAGADLEALASGDAERRNAIEPLRASDARSLGPMGPTRLQLRKPVIAAVDGYCVAGGLELALWCDLRVATERAVFGVFCRRFGVPLIDGGTVRLPRVVGMGRALDMVLTGRPVDAEEALAMGLVNRVVTPAALIGEAERLAGQLASAPATCLRNDRASVHEQWGLGERDALGNELRRGLETLRSGEALSGAHRFAAGAGRHGAGASEGVGAGEDGDAR